MFCVLKIVLTFKSDWYKVVGHYNQQALRKLDNAKVSCRFDNFASLHYFVSQHVSY